MTTKTRQQLVHQACAYLGLRTSGQAPSADDYETVDGYVDPTLAMLEQSNIARVQNDEEIEQAVFLPVALHVAAQAGPEFGVYNIDVSEATKTLYKVTATWPAGFVQKAVYF